MIVASFGCYLPELAMIMKAPFPKALAARRNAMKPQIQCVTTPWNPGSMALGAGRRRFAWGRWGQRGEWGARAGRRVLRVAGACRGG